MHLSPFVPDPNISAAFCLCPVCFLHS